MCTRMFKSDMLNMIMILRWQMIERYFSETINKFNLSIIKVMDWNSYCGIGGLRSRASRIFNFGTPLKNAYLLFRIVLLFMQITGLNIIWAIITHWNSSFCDCLLVMLWARAGYIMKILWKFLMKNSRLFCKDLLPKNIEKFKILKICSLTTPCLQLINSKNL